MGETIKEIRDKLWNGLDPLAGLPERLYEVDAAGWGGSQHPYLAGGIELVRPRVIVEIGVWKGASAIHMAGKLRELGLDAVVIAVDTWLGAWDHWIDPTWTRELNFSHGYPQVYYKFAGNVVASGLRDYIVPLPLDSVNAREVISRRGISVDMIHVDGGHDYAAVTADLEQWWPVLRTDGLFVGDDYVSDGSAWPDVKRAIDDFLARTPHKMFQSGGNKCAAYKA